MTKNKNHKKSAQDVEFAAETSVPNKKHQPYTPNQNK
jgi:hypothetical protein